MTITNEMKREILKADLIVVDGRLVYGMTKLQRQIKEKAEKNYHVWYAPRGATQEETETFIDDIILIKTTKTLT